MSLRFVVRGARGTMPVCGRDFLRYGGKTSCFTLETGKDLLIVDAGTGLIEVSQELVTRAAVPPITWFFTHLHMDHLIGLPAFGPLYRDDVSIRFMADGAREGDWKGELRAFMSQPFWPVGLLESGAEVRFEDLPCSADRTMTWGGVRVSWCPVPHPQGCLAYRFETLERSLVLATDVEFAAGEPATDFITFAQNADYLLMDAHYDPVEYTQRCGWGHSSWEAAVEMALRAGVGELVLIHHAPERKDVEVDWIVEQAARRFSRTRAASDGLVLPMGG